MAPEDSEDLERYETEMELRLYREYRDVLPMFAHVIETDRRFYLANKVDVKHHNDSGRSLLEIELNDAWVWDMHRPARFVQRVRVFTTHDVNIEDLSHNEESIPGNPDLPGSSESP